MMKLVLCMVAVTLLAHVTAAERPAAAVPGCRHTHADGSSHLIPLNSGYLANDHACYCGNTPSDLECSDEDCDGWGDVHYTSYDGKKFNFQGICRYILTRECCIRGAFTIEVEQKTYTATTSVTDKFTIRVGAKYVTLDKVGTDHVIYVNDALPNPPTYLNPAVPSQVHNDAEFIIDELGTGWVLVTLKGLGVWFAWDWQYHVKVFVNDRHKNRLCGLCGDYNSDPVNDVKLTPSGEELNPPLPVAQWGELWRTANGQPDHCKPNGGGDDCDKYKEHTDRCKEIIGQIAQGCDLDPTQFIEDCEIEVCECMKRNEGACVCRGVRAYIEACRRVGANSDKWPQLDHGCCYDRVLDHYFENGESWINPSNNCYKITCVHGQRVYTYVCTTCTYAGQTYLHGATAVIRNSKCVCGQQTPGQWFCIPPLLSVDTAGG